MRTLIGIIIFCTFITVIACSTSFYNKKIYKNIKKTSVGHFIKVEPTDYIICQSIVITDKARLVVFGEPGYIPNDVELYVEEITSENYHEWSWFKFKETIRKINRYLTWDNGERYKVVD